MATTGQTINDRLNAVRYALVGQGLARTVCKATTEEVLGPKKKHTDYLLACTNEPNVSIPQMANLLIERTRHTSWAVVFKSLTTIHYLMSNGNERFTQYLATSNHSFELSDFMDRTTPQGYNMSNFVRRYAKYINEKVISYRLLALDLCKVFCGDVNNALKKMNMDKISKTLPVVQGQFDAILDFGVEQKDLNNGVIMYAFRLLCKDLFKLYVAYQELIINLLGRYFNLNYRRTREALDAYKGYLTRMDKVENFMKVTDSIGLDKNEMPDFNKAPATILATLERHYAQMDPKKRGAPSTSPEVQESVGSEDLKTDDLQPSKSIEQKEQPESPKSHDEPDKSPPKPEGARSPSPIPVEASPKKSSGEASPKAPPKPNRPSPVSTMKRESPQRPETKSSPSSTGQEKKIPPERPAKPPSRPPPPTSIGGSSASGPSLAKSSVTETKTPAPKVATTPSPQPPPPPPPPVPAHPARPPSPTIEPAPCEDSKAIAQSVEQEPEQVNSSEGVAHATNGGVEAQPPLEDGAPAGDDQQVNGCHPVEQLEPVVEQEPNHLGNELNEPDYGAPNEPEDLDVMPPPPPPLDEDADPEGEIDLPEEADSQSSRAHANDEGTGE